ncbi:uncharacterized protein [Primulina eburnea]|uniref:uncharacterized protein n=1 Tax=Primulina eburnea TaxID=1245227 RepID=UPI003C6C89A5
MSKITKWKLDKTKVKVVFRLQFHATHVPQNGWDKLFISFIPADSGKPTAKTTKANVRNGTCKWADPIYETTRLLQDSKSKQYDEKLYKLVVAMGASRASILGEATIDLSDHVDALKPSAVALSLHGCDFGTILHVTVQLLTSKTGFREFEQQRDHRERGLQSGDDSRGHNNTGKIRHTEEVSASRRSDANDLSSLEEYADLNEEYADSAAGFDGSSNTSESIFAEKHDTSSIQDVDSLKIMFKDLQTLSHCQSPHSEKGDSSEPQNMAQGSSDSAFIWDSVYSFDNELAIAREDNNRLRESLGLAESSFLGLKLEVSSLQSLAGELGTETQNFSHLLTSELFLGEELAKEVSAMKLECLKLKDDINMLKDLKSIPQIAISETSDDRNYHLLEDVKLQFLKVISVAEGKIRELQGKTYIFADGCDGRLIYSELEALLSILRSVKQGNGDATNLLHVVPSESTDVKEIREICTDEHTDYASENGFGLDLCHPESILQHFRIPPPVSDPSGAMDALKGQIFDLVRELDEAKVEKEGLIRKMDQMECYYETLIQELEENQKQMVGELQHLRNEHSTCLHALSSCRVEIESSHQEMNQKMIQFCNERHDLEVLNKELQRMVSSSEATLRRARLNYSIAVDKLQKDLELLSSQVVSMHETNENLIKQAFIQPSELNLQGNHNFLKNPEDYDAKHVPQHQNQCWGDRRKSLGGDILLEDLKRSFSLQEELYQKVEAELIEMCNVNLNLDIYSKTLKESLLEANAEIGIMKGKMDEFVAELELLNASQNQLMMRLNEASDDIHRLNEYKSSCISQRSELALQNQLLEDKLEILSEENNLFSEKVKDLEIIKMEYRSCQSKIETYLTENVALSLSLKQEAFEKEKLQNELSLLEEKWSILKSESDELASLKENQDDHISFMQDKLANLLESYNKKVCVLTNSHCLDFKHIDTKDSILQLEEIQHNACGRIFQLIEQNKNLEGEIVTARLEIMSMKQKFKSDMHDMVTKLDASNALVEKLQTQLESIDKKFQFSFEIEEKYVQQSKSLLADLGLLEDRMQELTCKNGHFTQETACLDALVEELGSSKSAICALMQEKRELLVSLKNEDEKSVKISSEFTYLKESLSNLNDELQRGKVYRDELEGKIKDLTSQLNKDHAKLIYLEQKNVELVHTRGLALDLELEKSRLAHLLEQQMELMKELHHQISDQSSLECQLLLLYDYSLAADVELTYVSNQYRSLCKKYSQQLVLSESSLREERERYHELEVTLNRYRTSEAHLSEERENLMKILKRLESESEVAEAQNRLLSVYEEDLKNQLEECKSKLATVENSSSLDKILQASEVEKLKNMMIDAEKRYRSSEAHLSEERDNLMKNLKSLESEVEVAKAQNKLLSVSNDDVENQLEECKRKLATVENSSSLDKILQASEVEKMKNMMIDAEKHISCLTVSKEELEILILVLKGKLNEQCTDTVLLEDYKDTVMELRSQCDEISHMLSEQVLKTEEFKNLSIHLKELKDEAENELRLACEKKEAEGNSVAVHDSLRVAFMKEQHETQLQELKQKLSISKKHGEEMFLKLQDASDEVENRKKSEAVNLKRNEELSHKIMDIEKELQLVLAEKREMSKDYDRVRAELECALLSLECCKEEKGKLEAYLQDCEAEKSQLAVEINLAKVQLENHTKVKKHENGSVIDVGYSVNELPQKSSPIVLDHNKSTYSGKRIRATSTLADDDADLAKAVELRTFQDGGKHQIPEAAVGEHPWSNGKNSDVKSDCLGSHILKSSLEHLQEELEKMKKENIDFHIDHEVDPNLQVPQREIIQLEKANEELRNMFPLFNDISSSGNALKRVLDLEIALAESLKANKKLNTQFQSSFLKQHGDEESVFKSFRDINELIKEMLELKGRHAMVETELREMHHRYSRLSLQFAEVEGERQKLKMTLKNVRASRKDVTLNRTSSVD